jgi:hydroxymethylglutaryl-CoA lyase
VSDFAHIIEVSPRDGLQNEPVFVATEDKLELIARLIDSGLHCIEATSFVSPKWVPQMADADAVCNNLPLDINCRFPVLVPNLQGYMRARACGVKEVAVFTAASETFSRKNTNASIAESLVRIKDVCEHAQNDGVAVRGYISTVLGCPYQGKVDVHGVVRIAKDLQAMGCYEISLGDTIGVGTAKDARALLLAVAGEIPMMSLAVHFHDTYGQALSNVFACLEAGVRRIDASVSGTGGCPYAKGASGNLATEDLIYALHGMGFDTGVDLDKLVKTGAWLSDKLGRASNSKVNRAMNR